MGIDGFTSLGMPLNLAEPACLEHVSSVFLFSFCVCERNLPLCIGSLVLELKPDEVYLCWNVAVTCLLLTYSCQILIPVVSRSFIFHEIYISYNN